MVWWPHCCWCRPRRLPSLPMCWPTRDSFPSSKHFYFSVCASAGCDLEKLRSLPLPLRLLLDPQAKLSCCMLPIPPTRDVATTIDFFLPVAPKLKNLLFWRQKSQTMTSTMTDGIWITVPLKINCDGSKELSTFALLSIRLHERAVEIKRERRSRAWCVRYSMGNHTYVA